MKDPSDPLADVDLDKLVQGFRVAFVHPDDLGGDIIAVHKLTTVGRKQGMEPDEIWIDERFREWSDILVLHEAVENWLRKRGWSYSASHDYAMILEVRLFGDTQHYKDYLAATFNELDGDQ